MFAPVDAMLDCAWFWGIRFDASAASPGYNDDQCQSLNQEEHLLESGPERSGSSALPIMLPLPLGTSSINETPSFLFSMSMSPRFGGLSLAAPSDLWLPSAGPSRLSFEGRPNEVSSPEMEAANCVGSQPGPESSSTHLIRQMSADEDQAAALGHPSTEEEEVKDLDKPWIPRHNSDIFVGASSGVVSDLVSSENVRPSPNPTPLSFAPLCLLSMQPPFFRNKEYVGSIASAVTPHNSGISPMPESYTHFSRDAMSASIEAKTTAMNPVLGSAMALENMMGVTLPPQSFMEEAKQIRSKQVASHRGVQACGVEANRIADQKGVA